MAQNNKNINEQSKNFYDDIQDANLIKKASQEASEISKNLQDLGKIEKESQIQSIRNVQNTRDYIVELKKTYYDISKDGQVVKKVGKEIVKMVGDIGNGFNITDNYIANKLGNSITNFGAKKSVSKANAQGQLSAILNDFKKDIDLNMRTSGFKDKVERIAYNQNRSSKGLGSVSELGLHNQISWYLEHEKLTQSQINEAEKLINERYSKANSGRNKKLNRVQRIQNEVKQTKHDSWLQGLQNTIDSLINNEQTLINARDSALARLNDIKNKGIAKNPEKGFNTIDDERKYVEEQSEKIFKNYTKKINSTINPEEFDKMLVDFSNQLIQSRVKSIDTIAAKWDRSIKKPVRGLTTDGVISGAIKKTYKDVKFNGVALVDDAQDIANNLMKAKAQTYIPKLTGTNGRAINTSLMDGDKISQLNAKLAKNQISMFDFETIGDKGTDVFSPTQFAITDDKGNIQKYIFRLQEDSAKYINNVLTKARAGQRLTDTEKRDLLHMTDYRLGDGKLIAEHKDYDSGLRVEGNTSLIQKAEEGFKLLQQYGLENYDEAQNMVLKLMNQKGRTLSAHNGRNFDMTPLKKMMSGTTFDVNNVYSNLLDTLELARSYFSYGQKGANGNRLFGFRVSDFMDFYGLNAADIAKQTGTTQHTADFDIVTEIIIAKKMLDDIINGKASFKGELDNRKSKGNTSMATKSFARRNSDAYSFVVGADGKIKNSDKLIDNLLLQKGHYYTNRGIKESNGRNYVEWFDEITGDTSFINYESQEELDNITSGSFNNKFMRRNSDNIKNASLSKMLTSNSAFYHLDNLIKVLNGQKLNNNINGKGQAEILADLLTGPKSNDDDKILVDSLKNIYKQINNSELQYHQKNLAVASLANQLGIVSGSSYSVKDIQDYVQMYSDGTVASEKQAFVKFLNENKGAFQGKDFVWSDILEHITNLDVGDVRYKSSGLQHGLANWILQEMNQPEDTKANAYTKIKNFQNANNEVANVIDTIKNRISAGGVNNVVNMFNANADTDIREFLEGTTIKKRLKTLRTNKKGGRGKVSDSEISEITKSVRPLDRLNNIRSVLESHGIGMYIGQNDGMLDLGLYDSSRENDYFKMDKDGNFVIDREKMANIMLPTASKDGILTFNGNKKIDYINPKFGADGLQIGSVTTDIYTALENFITSREGTADNQGKFYHNGTSTFWELITGNNEIGQFGDASLAQSMLKRVIRTQMESLSSTGATTSPSVLNEIASTGKHNGNALALKFKSSIVDLNEVIDSWLSQYEDSNSLDSYAKNKRRAQLQDFYSLYAKNNASAEEMKEKYKGSDWNWMFANEGAFNNIIKTMDQLKPWVVPSVEDLKPQMYNTGRVSTETVREVMPGSEFSTKSQRGFGQRTNEIVKLSEGARAFRDREKGKTLIEGKTVHDNIFYDANATNMELLNALETFDTFYTTDTAIKDFFGAATLAEDSSIVRHNMLNAFGSESERRIKFSNEDMNNFVNSLQQKGYTVKELQNFLHQAQSGQQMDIVDQQKMAKAIRDFGIAMPDGKSIEDLNSVLSISKTLDGYEMMVKDVVSAENKRKIVNSTRQRETLNYSAEDDVMNNFLRTKLAEIGGDLSVAQNDPYIEAILRGTTKISKVKSFSADNVGGMLHERMNFIFGHAIERMSEQGLDTDTIVKTINDKISNLGKNNAMSRYMRAVNNNGKAAMMRIGYQDETGRYFGNDDKLLLENESEVMKFLHEDSKGSYLSQLGKSLFGDSFYKITRGFGRSSINRADDAYYFDPTGSTEDVFESRRSIQQRERDSIARQIGTARLKNKDEDFNLLEDYLGKLTTTKATDSNVLLRDRIDLGNIMTINANDPLQTDSMKTKINSLFETGEKQLIDIVTGRDRNSLKDNEILLEDLVNNVRQSGAGYEQGSFGLTPYSIMSKKMSDLGYSKDKTLFRVNFDENTGMPNIGQLGEMSNGLFFSLGQASKLDDGTIAISEYDHKVASMLKNVYRATSGEKSVEESSSELSYYLNEYLKDTYELGHQKDSALYKDINKVGLPNSTAKKAGGINYALQKEILDNNNGLFLENSTFFTKNEVKKMLQTDQNASSDMLNKNITNLQYDIANMLGVGADANGNLDMAQLQAAWDSQLSADSKIGKYGALSNLKGKALETKLIDTLLSMTDITGVFKDKNWSLDNVYNRYPSTTGLDAHFGRIRTFDNKGIFENISSTDAHGLYTVGSMIMQNMDFDGDTGYSSNPFLAFDSKNQSYADYMKLKTQFDKVRQIEDSVAIDLAKMFFSSYSDEPIPQEEIDEKVKEYVKTFNSKHKLESESEILSKRNFEKIGIFSNRATLHRNIMKNLGFDEVTSNNLDNIEASLGMRSFFESFEQDTISAKHVEQRMRKQAANLLGKNENEVSNSEIESVYFDELDKLSSILAGRKSDGSWYSESKNGFVSMIKDSIAQAQSMGIFSEGTGDDVVFSGRQAKIAIARTKAQKGLKYAIEKGWYDANTGILKEDAGYTYNDIIDFATGYDAYAKAQGTDIFKETNNQKNFEGKSKIDLTDVRYKTPANIIAQALKSGQISKAVSDNFSGAIAGGLMAGNLNDETGALKSQEGVLKEHSALVQNATQAEQAKAKIAAEVASLLVDESSGFVKSGSSADVARGKIQQYISTLDKLAGTNVDGKVIDNQINNVNTDTKKNITLKSLDEKTVHGELHFSTIDQRINQKNPANSRNIMAFDDQVSIRKILGNELSFNLSDLEQIRALFRLRNGNDDIVATDKELKNIASTFARSQQAIEQGNVMHAAGEMLSKMSLDFDSPDAFDTFLKQLGISSLEKDGQKTYSVNSNAKTIFTDIYNQSKGVLSKFIMEDAEGKPESLDASLTPNILVENLKNLFGLYKNTLGIKNKGDIRYEELSLASIISDGKISEKLKGTIDNLSIGIGDDGKLKFSIFDYKTGKPDTEKHSRQMAMYQTLIDANAEKIGSKIFDSNGISFFEEFARKNNLNLSTFIPEGEKEFNSIAAGKLFRHVVDSPNLADWKASIGFIPYSTEEASNGENWKVIESDNTFVPKTSRERVMELVYRATQGDLQAGFQTFDYFTGFRGDEGKSYGLNGKNAFDLQAEEYAQQLSTIDNQISMLGMKKAGLDMSNPDSKIKEKQYDDEIATLIERRAGIEKIVNESTELKSRVTEMKEAKILDSDQGVNVMSELTNKYVNAFAKTKTSEFVKNFFEALPDNDSLKGIIGNTANKHILDNKAPETNIVSRIEEFVGNTLGKDSSKFIEFAQGEAFKASLGDVSSVIGSFQKNINTALGNYARSMITDLGEDVDSKTITTIRTDMNTNATQWYSKLFDSLNAAGFGKEDILKIQQSMLRGMGITEGFSSDSTEANIVKLAESSTNKAITGQDSKVNGMVVKADDKAAQQYEQKYLDTQKELHNIEMQRLKLQSDLKKKGPLEQVQIQEQLNMLNNQYAQIAADNPITYKNGAWGTVNPITGDFNIVQKYGSTGARKNFEQKYQRQQDRFTMDNRLLSDQLGLGKQGFFSKFYTSLRGSMDYYLIQGMAYQVTGKIMQTFSTVIAKIKELDKTFVDLQIVTGKTRNEVQEMVKEHSKLALKIGATTQEVNAAANEFYRMGYNDMDTSKLIEASMTLSKLGMIDSTKASEYMISSVKGYDVNPEDAMNIVDMASELDMKYAVSAGYILEAMARTASSAKMAGVEMGELQSLISIVGETSQKDASVVGESFKTAFARYGNLKAGAFLDTDLATLGEGENSEEYTKVNDIEKVLTKLGINIREDDLKTWRSYSDILDEVGLKWKTYSDYEKNAITTAMFGTRQRENGIIALDNYNRVLEANNIVSNSAGTAYQKMTKYQEGLEAATKKMTSAFEAAISRFAGGARLFVPLIDMVTALITHFEIFGGVILATLAYLKFDSIVATVGKFSNLFANTKLAQGLGGFGPFLKQNGIKGTLKKGFVDIPRDKWRMGANVVEQDADLREQIKNRNIADKKPFSDDDIKNNRDGNIAEKKSANILEQILQILKFKWGTNNIKSDMDADDVDSISNIAAKQERGNIHYKQNKINSLKKINEKNANLELQQEKEISQLKSKIKNAGNFMERYANDVRNMENINENLRKKGLLGQNESYNDAINRLRQKQSSYKKGKHAYKKIENDIRLLQDAQKEQQRMQNFYPSGAMGMQEEIRMQNAAIAQLNKKRLQLEKNKTSKNAINSQIAMLENEIAQHQANIAALSNENGSKKKLLAEGQILSDWQQKRQQFDKKKTRTNFTLYKQAEKRARSINSNYNIDATPEEIQSYIDDNNLKISQLSWTKKDWKKYYKQQQLEYKTLREKYIKNGVRTEDWKKLSKEDKRAYLNQLKEAKKNINNASNNININKNGFSSQAANNAMTTAGSMLGMYGFSQIGSAIGQKTGSETGAGVGSLIGSIAGMTVPMLFGGPAGLAIGAAAMAIGVGIQIWNSKVEKAINRLTDEMSKLEESLQQAKGAKNDVARYDQLALGVSETGKNISLSDEEFDEFQALGNKLKNIFPDLIIGTDTFGNALLGAEGKLGGLSSVIDTITKSYQQQLDAKYFEEDKRTSLAKEDFKKMKEKEKVWDDKQANFETDDTLQHSAEYFEKYKEYLKRKNDGQILNEGEQNEFDNMDHSFNTVGNKSDKFDELAKLVPEDIANNIKNANTEIIQVKDATGKFVKQQMTNWSSATMALQNYIRSNNETERRKYILENYSDKYAAYLRNANGYNNMSEDEQFYAMNMLNNLSLPAETLQHTQEMVQTHFVNMINNNPQVSSYINKINDDTASTEEKTTALKNLIDVYKLHFDRNQGDFQLIAEALGYKADDIYGDKSEEILRKFVDPTGAVVTSSDIQDKIKTNIQKANLGTDVDVDKLAESISKLNQGQLKDIMSLNEVDFSNIINGAESTEEALNRLTNYIAKNMPDTISDLGKNINQIANDLGVLNPLVLFNLSEDELDTLFNAKNISEQQREVIKNVIAQIIQASKDNGINIYDIVNNPSDFSGLNANGTSSRTSKQLREESSTIETVLSNLSNSSTGQISQEDAEAIEEVAPELAVYLGTDIEKFKEEAQRKLSNNRKNLRGVYLQDAFNNKDYWQTLIGDFGISSQAATNFGNYQAFLDQKDIFKTALLDNNGNEIDFSTNDVSEDDINNIKQKMQDSYFAHMRDVLNIDVTDENFEEQFKKQYGTSFEDYFSIVLQILKNKGKIEGEMDIFADMKIRNVDVSNLKTELENAFNSAIKNLQLGESIRNALLGYKNNGFFSIEGFQAMITNPDVVELIGKSGFGYGITSEATQEVVNTSANNTASALVKLAMEQYSTVYDDSGNPRKGVTKEQKQQVDSLIKGYANAIDNLTKVDWDGMKQRQKDYEKAKKDFDKQQRDFDKQMKDFAKQERLNALNNLISSQKAIVENISTVLSAIENSIQDIGSTDLDFGTDLMNQKMDLLIYNSDILNQQYQVLSQQSHSTADETRALADALNENGNNIINNITQLRNLKKEMTSLGAGAINELLNTTTSISDAQNSFVERSKKRTGRYNDFLSNDYYSSGLFSQMTPENVIEKQKQENEEILRLHKKFTDKKLKLEKDYLAKLSKEQKEELERNRQDAIDSWERTKQEFNKSWADMIDGAKARIPEIETKFKTIIDSMKDLVAGTGNTESLQAILDSLHLDPQLKKDIEDILKLRQDVDDIDEDNPSTNLPEPTLNKMKVISGYGLNSAQKEMVKNTAAPVESNALQGLKKGMLVYANSKTSPDGHSLLYLGNGWFLSNEGGTATVKTESEVTNSGYEMYDYSDFAYQGKEVTLTDSDRNVLVDRILEDKDGIISASANYAGKCLRWARELIETSAAYELRNSDGRSRYPSAVNDGSMGKNGHEAAQKYGHNVRHYMDTKNTLDFAPENYASGTPTGNIKAKDFGIAGENYKPEILIDKNTGETSYISSPTVIDISKTDVVGEYETARLPKFATGTPTDNQTVREIIKRVCDKYNVPYEYALSILDQERGNNITLEKNKDGNGYTHTSWQLHDRGVWSLVSAEDKQKIENAIGKTGDEFYEAFEIATDYAIGYLAKNYKNKGTWWEAIKKYNGAGQQATNYANQVYNRSQQDNFQQAAQEMKNQVISVVDDVTNSDEFVQITKNNSLPTGVSKVQNVDNDVDSTTEQFKEELSKIKEYNNRLEEVAKNAEEIVRNAEYQFSNDVIDLNNSEKMRKLLYESNYSTDENLRNQAEFEKNRLLIEAQNKSLKSQMTATESLLFEIQKIIVDMESQGLDASEYKDLAMDLIGKIEYWRENIDKNTESNYASISASANNLVNLNKIEEERIAHEIDMGFIVGDDIAKAYEDLAKGNRETIEGLVANRLQLEEEFRMNNVPMERWMENDDYANIISQIRTQEQKEIQNIISAKEHFDFINEFSSKQLENEKPNEWKSLSQIKDYYEEQVTLTRKRKEYIDEILETQTNLSDEQRNQLIEERNLLEVEEERTLQLEKQQAIFNFKDKQYGALTWQVNEYIDLLEDEKDEVSERYDEEIKKLQKTNESKERSIELSKLLNNLENAQKEKKRVYRTGIGFVYEADRDEVKKAQDELDAFYRKDRVQDLENAKNAELDALNDRIEGWQKYLEALEDIYKTHEKNQNQAILKDLLGVSTIAEINDILFNDRDSYLLQYESGIKNYTGKFTDLLNSITSVQDKLASLEKTSLDLIDYSSVENVPQIIDDNWKKFASINNVDDFQYLLNTYSNDELKELFNVSRATIQAMHNKKMQDIDSLIASGTDINSILSGDKQNITGFSVEQLRNQVLPRKYEKILSAAENNNLDDIINGDSINNTGLSASDLLLAKKVKQLKSISDYDDDEIIQQLIRLSNVSLLLPDIEMDIQGEATLNDEKLSSKEMSIVNNDIPTINSNSVNDYYKMIANAISNGLNVLGITEGLVPNNSLFTDEQMKNDVLPYYMNLLNNAQSLGKDKLSDIIKNPSSNNTGLHLEHIRQLFSGMSQDSIINAAKSSIQQMVDVLAGNSNVTTPSEALKQVGNLITGVNKDIILEKYKNNMFFKNMIDKNVDSYDVSHVYIVDDNLISKWQPVPNHEVSMSSKIDNISKTSGITIEKADFYNVKNADNIIYETLRRANSQVSLNVEN